MKILVDECAYDPILLKGVLPEGCLLLTEGKVKIEHIGYFRSAMCDDFLFFLPKEKEYQDCFRRADGR